MQTFVGQIHLLCQTTDRLMETGVRVSMPLDLGIVYKLIEGTMLGTQSKKHYFFACSEADLGLRMSRDGVMRVVPAYRRTLVVRKDEKAKSYYVASRAYKVWSDFGKLLADLRAANMSIAHVLPQGVTEEAVLKDFYSETPRGKALQEVYYAAAHDDNPAEFVRRFVTVLAQY